MLIIDHQIQLRLDPLLGGYRFFYKGKNHDVATIEKVHELFSRESIGDTVKLCCGENKSYLHRTCGGYEVYSSKKSLRRQLSRECGGAWCEENGGEKRYFIEEKGWFGSSIREVPKEECLVQESTVQKILGVGLSILALSPSIEEFTNRHSLGSKEALTTLVGLSEKNALFLSLGYFLCSSQVQAQDFGQEFLVNTHVGGEQRFPCVTYLGDETFVIVWHSHNQDGSLYGIYGQRFTIDGYPLGGEFLVNTFTLGQQRFPSVAPLQDEGFVVVWESSGQEGTYNIYGRKFHGNGTAVGDEFLVNAGTPFDSQNPDVAFLENGDFVVVWQNNGQDGDGLGIFGRKFAANGSVSNGNLQINMFNDFDQRMPRITATTGGGFIVVWESDTQDGSSYAVIAQRYDSFSLVAESEFLVNSYTVDDQQSASMQVLKGGDYVIVWESDLQDRGGFGIYAQLYSSVNTPLGSEFRVNSFTDFNQRYPDVAELVDGGFVIVWQSFSQDGDDYGIYGKRYANNGTVLFGEFKINDHTQGYQQRPRVAGFSTGGYVVTWYSNNQDNLGGDGVFAKIYDAQNVAVFPPVLDTESDAFTESENTFFSSLSPNPTLSSSTGRSTTSEILSSSQLSSNSLSSMSPNSTLSPNTARFTISEFPSSSQLSSNPISTSVISTFLSLTIVYDQVYSIVQNGQTIGTYTFSGGSGQFDPNNSNTLTIEFDPDFNPEVGDVITLFTFAADQAGQWDNLIVDTENLECLEARGEVATDTTSSSQNFQLIFETADSCVTAAIRFGVNLIPLTT